MNMNDWDLQKQQEEDLWLADLLQRNLQLSIEKGCTPEQIENCRIERDNVIVDCLERYKQMH